MLSESESRFFPRSTARDDEVDSIWGIEGTAAGAGVAVAAPSQAGSLSFENVVVRYDGAKNNAVDGVTLTIGHGETVAFVGPNGCGKTTLLSTAERACAR